MLKCLCVWSGRAAGDCALGDEVPQQTEGQLCAPSRSVDEDPGSAVR